MKKLEQLRQESKEIKDKIEDTEERLRQLKNQEKKILKQYIIKRRKEDIKTIHNKKKKRKNSQANNKRSNLRKPYRK